MVLRRPAPEREENAMRGKTRPDRQWGKRRYMIHFSTGDAAMRFSNGQLEVGSINRERNVRGVAC